MSKSSNKEFNMFNGIWLLVVMLLLFVTASGVLVYSIIGSFSDGDKNVIMLIPAHNGKGEVSELKPNPNGEKEGWEASTSIDLFKTTYIGPDGQITVDSANGDKVIAPGTSNSYEFSLKNTGNIQMDFTMTLKGLFTFTDMDLPFEVRLYSGDTWLVGDKNIWKSVDSLADIEIKNTIERGKYINYTLEWQWPFESNDEQNKLLTDLNDTLLGNTSSEANVNFSLNIHTLATITDGSVPKNEKGWVMLTKIINPILLYIVLTLIILLTAGGIIWFVIAKKKKNEKENDEDKTENDEDETENS